MEEKFQITCPRCGQIFTMDNADYATILTQVKTDAFKQEVEHRLAELREVQQTELKAMEIQLQAQHEKDLQTLQKETLQLEAKLSQADSERQAAVLEAQAQFQKALQAKDLEATKLQALLEQAQSQQQAAVLEAQAQFQRALQEKEQVINDLKIQQVNLNSQTLAEKQTLQSECAMKVKLVEQERDYYKDFKARQSTKMVGESLEVHCSTQFEQIRSLLPYVYFEKDNEVVNGSKGDFVLRAYASREDQERNLPYLSILFEMKNEMESTQTKHCNKDFFAKLDRDRCNKGCEYAVLVSLLEADSELYNNGIFVVPQSQYENMYVIRPQFFIPLITFLLNAEKKTVALRQMVDSLQQQSIDVTNFESQVDLIKTKFGQAIGWSHQRFTNASEQIDKVIKMLQDIKESFRVSEGHLDKADKILGDLTIRKLTQGNPTMKAKFDALNAANTLAPSEEDTTVSETLSAPLTDSTPDLPSAEM